MMPGSCVVPLQAGQYLSDSISVQGKHLRNGMRLATTRGAICEDGGVVSIQDAVQEPTSRRLEYIAL